MINYNWLNGLQRKQFYTIPEACKLLGLDTDKLRYQCLLHGILPASYKGVLGLDENSFRRIGSALWIMQYTAKIDGDPWA